MMFSPSILLRASMLAFLFGLATILIYLALAGRLRLRELLSEPRTPGAGQRRFSWAGVQLLIVSAITLGLIVGRWTGAWDPTSAYTIGVTLVLVVSQAIYLRSTRRLLEFDP
jgi:hypothetical protein